VATRNAPGPTRRHDLPHVIADTAVVIPVVLFMENYDINRTEYHGTHDNMSIIDLDYGSAVAAIAIEGVGRIAHAPAGSSPLK
jgi:hypothetical protein